MKIRNKQIIVILLIIIFHAVNNYIWLRLNQRPIFDDDAFHSLAALKIAVILQHFSWSDFTRLISFPVVSFYPPFFHFCMAISNIIFGKSLISSVMTNIFFLAVLSGSLYYIGKKMGNKNIGVLSFFLVSMYPFVFGLSRTPFPDFALTAMVTFSLCCLIYTDDFTNSFFSLLFGFSLGLGMLTKQVFVFFIVTPLVFTILKLFFGKGMYKARAVNLSISFLTAFFLSGYWYISNLKYSLPEYMRAAYIDAPMFGPCQNFSFDSASYYIRRLADNQVLPFFCIIFILGVFIFFRSKIKMKTFLLLSLLGPLAIFTFLIQTKEPKSTVPYLPVFALISAAGILDLKQASLKRFLIVLSVVFGLYQYYIVSCFELSKWAKRIPRFGFLVPAHNLRPIVSYHHFFSRGSLKLDEVLSLIEEREKAGNKRAGVAWQNAAKMRWLDIPWKDNYAITNGSAIRYYSQLKGLNSTIVSLNNRELPKPWWKDEKLLPGIIFLVYPLEKQAPDYVVKKYRLLKTIDLTDKSRVYVYVLPGN
jgi:4-amino-4-deoxy-L-arabinose transferase-like glycosyltransferase